ncbi:hypothetical protein ACIBCN_39620 [Nocardia sp. NPDC051052]
MPDPLTALTEAEVSIRLDALSRARLTDDSELIVPVGIEPGS